MNTPQMEIALFAYLGFMQSTVVHQVTDMSGLVHFEADVLKVSLNGYATAYEIKVSKADLLKDQKKSHIINCENPNYFDRYFKPIKQFYYAVPPKLVNHALLSIPHFAGLVEISNMNTVKVIREAKINGRCKKWSRQEICSLRRLGSLRLYKHLITIERLNRKLS